ncbi:aspartate/glutamate racemase family protein [Streptomyces sp. NBC_00820]|uniref:aspartate/glutamate racemase family protein n=1 Tax=Streptomyces sp. NBC_00820 TaxID=2975842 RepID=UPI003FA7E28A
MLALLHTSPVHVPVFDALRRADHPGLELRHFVDEELLARARRDGPDAVTADVRDALLRAADAGAAAVLCTCSTIGAVAEAQAGTAGLPVLRVDRPMAAAAVAAGSRVVVLATVESTVAPTVALIEEEARAVGRAVSVRPLLVEGAWERFAAGDTDGCAQRVAAVADSVTEADAIVLAQASMTPAQDLTTTTIPILSSPRPGLAAAASAATRGCRLDQLGSAASGTAPRRVVGSAEYVRYAADPPLSEAPHRTPRPDPT